MPNDAGASTMMRAMQLSEWGGAFEPVERPAPAPSARQVVVAVHSVGIGVTNELARRGEVVEREPYPEFEVATRRVYIFARKPA